MSYDLYFGPRDANRVITREELEAFFENGQHYTIQEEKVEYFNRDTGVYFAFYTHYDSESFRERRNFAKPLPIGFNLNVFRPHIFGLEAERELSAYVRRFDLLVEDPQENIEGVEFNADAFLRGWNQLNEFAHRVTFNPDPQLPQHDDFKEMTASVHTLPAKEIERHWKWNYGRARLQAHYGDRISVPSVVFMEHNGVAASATLWLDGTPVALPAVDLVFFGRVRLAPRRIFRRKDVVLFAWQDLEPFLAQFEGSASQGDHVLVDSPELPKPMVSFIRRSRRYTGQPNRIAVADILDRELVEKVSP